MTGFTKKRGSTWTAYWETKDPATGKRRQHSKGGFRVRSGRNGEIGAEDYLATIIGKVTEGTWRPDKPLTVQQLLEDHWLPAQRSRELRESTIDQYENVVAHWLVPHIGALRASALTPANVQKLQLALKTQKTATGRKGLSPRSVQLAVGVLKSACSWAVPDLLARDPVARVKRPRQKARTMKAWNADQARAFLASTEGDRLAAAWALFLTRGLRRGEIAGLRWDAVTERTLQVKQTRVVVDGRALDSEPKTEAGRRTISLDDSLLALLRSHRARQSAERLAAGSAWEGVDDYVFCDELGRPYHPDHFSDRFEQLVRASGQPMIRLHDTRHTAASLMLASGVPVKVVSEMLGHSSPTITLSIYAHLMPGMAEEAGAALSASLLG
jgi:integrase